MALQLMTGLFELCFIRGGKKENSKRSNNGLTTEYHRSSNGVMSGQDQDKVREKSGDDQEKGGKFLLKSVAHRKGEVGFWILPNYIKKLKKTRSVQSIFDSVSLSILPHSIIGM